MLKNPIYTREALQKVVRELLKKGGDFAEIFVEKSSLQSISCEENKIESIASGLDVGLGLRIVQGEETYYASTNSQDLAEIAALAGNLSQAAGKRQVADSSWKIVDKNSGLVHAIERYPQGIGITEKITLVNRVNTTAWKKDPRIQQVQVGYGDRTKEIIIANSLGLFREEKRIYVILILNIVAQSGTIVQTGREVLGGLSGFEKFNEEAVGALIDKATARALKMLDARKAPSGKMPVVLDSEAGGTMIHEAIGHSLEADAVQKGISPVYKGKVGQKVASPLISVVDDATLPNMRGSFSCDDEGTPAQRTVLVEKGILKNYLYDLFTARKDGTISTGNGRRESYHYKPVPRMTNTMITPGEHDPKSIIKSTPKGLFVKKMGGGQVNTATGDFVFEIVEAYEIVNGEQSQPVRGAILTGNGPEVLKSIDMLGNDLNFEIGTCGKEGQHVPVGDGQPTLRIPEIIVGGTE
ncbi:MAG: TldD/PmbA family protein [Elusimicrobia bacterium]|nr:TldD/PmbA family protein [Elusimicrobiota bacterium]